MNEIYRSKKPEMLMRSPDGEVLESFLPSWTTRCSAPANKKVSQKE
jgi:hypothetical protein